MRRYAAFYWGRHFFGRAGAAITALATASWHELVYFAAKPLADVIATDFLVIAVFLVSPKTSQSRGWACFWSGCLLGIAAGLRLELAPIYLLVLLYIWIVWGRWEFVAATAGSMLTFTAAGMLDAVTWTYPFLSIFLRFWINIAEGISATMGVEPWYWYIGIETLNWAGALVFVGIFGAIGARRLPLLAVLVVAVLIIYSLIEHKTYRFIYPMLPFLVVLVGLGTNEVAMRLVAMLPARRLLLLTAAALCWPATSATLAVSDHFRVYLNKEGAILNALTTVGHRPDLCGLGIAGIKWWRTGGYTYLHRDVPMYLMSPKEAAQHSESFNDLIAEGQQIAEYSGFRRLSCARNTGFTAETSGDICLYRRPGDCVPSDQRRFENDVGR